MHIIMGSPKQPSTNSSSESWPSLFISKYLNITLAFSRGSNSGSLSSSSASNLEPICYTVCPQKVHDRLRQGPSLNVILVFFGLPSLPLSPHLHFEFGIDQGINVGSEKFGKRNKHLKYPQLQPWIRRLHIRVSKGRDVPGQTRTVRPVVPLSRDKKIFLSQCPFCPWTRAGANVPGQTPLSWDVLGQNDFPKRTQKTGKGRSKTGK